MRKIPIFTIKSDELNPWNQQLDIWAVGLLTKEDSLEDLSMFVWSHGWGPSSWGRQQNMFLAVSFCICCVFQNGILYYMYLEPQWSLFLKVNPPQNKVEIPTKTRVILDPGIYCLYIYIARFSKKNIPSRGLTYPTLGKGKSSSKCHFWGIC